MEKTKSYKRLIFSSIGSLSPVSALFKFDLATFAIRGKTIIGVDGGLDQVFAGAGDTSYSCHHIPHSGCAAQF